MRVLVACEFSGIVRDAFRSRGCDAVSCDLRPSERPGPHIEADVRLFLADGWDLMVAHPPCTYLSRAGARWWSDPERQCKADDAYAFVLALWSAPIPRIAIENPIGQLNRRWRYPDQTIQPHHFGHPYSKATCLWLKGLPPLMASLVEPEWSYWMDSYPGNWRKIGAMAAREKRGKARSATERARTFPGIAEAMAAQWGAR